MSNRNNRCLPMKYSFFLVSFLMAVLIVMVSCSSEQEKKKIQLETATVHLAKGEFKAAESKASDPLASLVKTTASSQPTTTAALSSSSNAQHQPALSPQTAAARRIAAVQRTLTEYGYGQLKATGTMGPDTQVAIQRFERERRLPVTGNVSDRLVRELGAMIGHPLDQ